MSRRGDHRAGARVILPRLSVELPGGQVSATSVEPTAAWVPATRGDISTGGVGFVLPVGSGMLRLGDRITVRFTLPDHSGELLVRAEVRHAMPHSDGGQRVGAAFTDADELIQHPLYRYIEEALLALRATSGEFGDDFRA